MNIFSISCLCNLSLGKEAWQSSEFGVAGDNATNVLYDDGKRDFGFHTKIEDSPWWEIDLKDVYKLSHIKLTNRRAGCQERAGTLMVEVSESGEDSGWQTVHTGIIHWDGDLNFFLAGQVKARWVRLSLTARAHFHLAKVEIWGCAPTVKCVTPPAPERFCLYDAPNLDGMDEISKGASVTKNGQSLTFDFGDIYPIEALVLEKPLAAGWGGAESLKIEISRDGHSWQRIHEGLMFWAAKMYYPLRGEVIGRFLRLSPGGAKPRRGFLGSFLTSANGLGLEKARVFTKKANLTVLMARPDGLGARLGALLTGLYLSKILNCEFKFVWEELGEIYKYESGAHNVLGLEVDSAEDLFSRDFIARYAADNEKAVDAGKFRKASNAFRRQILNGTFSDSPGKILAPLLMTPTRNASLLGLNPNLEPDKDFGFRQIFFSLPFHLRIQSVIDKALQLQLPEKLAAVHLRTGDMVYAPTFRKNLNDSTDSIGSTALNRFVSLPLAKMSVKKLIDDGFNVLAFSEDTEMLKILADEFPGSLHPASEFLPDSKRNTGQRNIFEIVLMSRARVIFAPRVSAFSTLSLAIGKETDYRSIHNTFTDDEILDFYLKDLSANQGLYPPLNAASAYKHLYILFRNKKQPGFLLNILREAAGLDPDNEFYIFYQAVEYYRAADYENGEKAIQRFLDTVTDMGQKPAAILGRPFPEAEEILKKAAEGGHPAACRAMAALCENSGNQAVAIYWREAALYGDSGIKNVALAGGQARQSSDFAWKDGKYRTDAANVLNDDGKRDMGCHTQIEENPWWEVELEDVYALHRIVLINRRRSCQERIMTLKVEVSAEKTGDEWLLIHSGLISWNEKLTLPLAGRVRARRVRLSLCAKNYFHLAAVEVWGAPLSVRIENQMRPETFYLYDQKPENGREGTPQTPPMTAPGLLMAELPAAAPLEALIISKTGLESWPDLKVETSRDGKDWLTVHEGLMYFDGQMHYPLQGEVFARLLRLSSQAEAEKGEKAAPVALKVFTTKVRPGVCVIHRKQAGFGDRMYSLLNAMYLADVLNIPMQMVWEAQNAATGLENESVNVLGIGVGEAEEIFDEKFISAHLRRDLPGIPNSKLSGQRGLARRSLFAPSLMDAPGLLHSPFNEDLGTLLSRGLRPSEPWELRRYFKQIGFAPEMRALVEKAEKVDLSGGMAAIHLRAGDMVYRSDNKGGEDSLFNFNNKALAVQLAKMSIEHALKSGLKNIIIFSDDLTVSQMLADDYKIKYARQFWPNGKLSTTKTTFFEIVLMSRASVIYRASNTFFSRVATAISEGVKTVDAYEFFKYEDILPYFQDDLKKNGARYPAPQNAFSYGYLYRASRGRQNTDFLLEMLAAAASFAPEYVTFKVYRALELFKAGRDSEGEAALAEVFSYNRQAKTFDLIEPNSKALRRNIFMQWRNAELQPVFEAAAKRNLPFACHITSLLYNAQGRQAETASWREAALRNIS